MKKLITLSVVFLGLLPALAQAKTEVTLSASQQNVEVGQQFSVLVTVTPSPETVYTSKISLSYPSDLVEATGFTFAPNWQGLSQPGFDAMGNGSIIKTAGYQGGLTSGKLFGTITFTAKKIGTAQVSVASDTHLYDQDNDHNAFSGTLNATSIVISEAAPAPMVQPVVKSTSVVKTPSLSGSAAKRLATSTATTSPGANDQTAAAVQSAGSRSLTYAILIIAAFILGSMAWIKFGKRGV